MKKFTILILLLAFLFNNSCSSSDSAPVEEDIDYSVPDWKCGFYNEHQLWTGPRGGCYYINSNGNKTYVDRSKCRC